MKLQLGCGTYPIEGYINSDIIKYPECEIVDLEKPLPYEDNSAEVILMSHVLSLPIFDTKIVPVLKEIFRVLQPGGIFRLWESPDRLEPKEMMIAMENIGFRSVHFQDYDKSNIQDPNIYKARGGHISFVLEATK